MRVIIKKVNGEPDRATMYCVGDIACEEGGSLSNTVLEKLKSASILQEIDSVEIIELFYKHMPLIRDVQRSSYYDFKDLRPVNTKDA